MKISSSDNVWEGGEGRRNKKEWKKGEQKLKRRRWKEEKEGRGKDDAAHRETVESIAVVRRANVSTIETEAVHVRSIRIGSS